MRHAFHPDAKTYDGVIGNLEIIGQAVRGLGSGELESRYPDIPWRQVAGLRKVLAHQYLGVDLSLVWNVVVRHLPPLRKAMEAELSRIPPPSGLLRARQ